MKKLRFLILFALLALLVHVGLTISGNQHIYKTLANTIFKGRLGPSIDEHKIYSNREVKAGEAESWKESFTNKTTSEHFNQKMQELESAAFLVVQNKNIVYEQYWDSYSSESITNSWSMAKSLVSIAIGAAIKEGKIESVNQKVGDFLPEFTRGKNKEITIKHLLTMSSGIEFGENYKSPFGFMAKTLYGSDIREITLEHQATYTPGSMFHYQGGNTLLLSLVIEMATGQKLSDYFSDKIWKPIGAEKPAFWSLDNENGYEKAFCCFNSNARDFAKIGQLYLDTGKWNGNQIIGKYYVLNSVKPVRLVTNEIVDFYGYSWWLSNYKNLKIFFARGIQGQYTICIPEKNMVIVRLGHKRDKEKTDNHPNDFYLYIDEALRLVE